MPRGRPPKLQVLTRQSRSRSDLLGDGDGSSSTPASRVLGDFVVPSSLPSTSAQVQISPSTAKATLSVSIPTVSTNKTVNPNLDSQSDAPIPPQKKQYAQVLKSSGKGMSLSYVKSVDKEVVLEVEDIASEVDYWSTTLVGTVLGKQTTIVELNSLVSKHWNHVTTPEILHFSKGWFYFRFLTVEDMMSIQSESWNVNGFLLVFKTWTPTIAEELDAVSIVPVWVLFPNLDPCFWSQAALSKVASFVGRPICADEPTTNKSKIAFARILVEVDLSKELPKGMTLQTPYRGTVLQKIVYEWLPYYCHTCHKIGHTKDRCNKNKVRQVYQPKQPVTETASTVQPVPVSEPVMPAKRVDKDGFIVTNSKKRSTGIHVEPVTSRLENQFSVLENPVTIQLEVDNDMVHVELDCGSVVDLEPGGIPPPLSPQ
ncbi:uncharacterized protein LOC141655697 [Silene latifolia]|uniref:uncharacterized protein LOC141655697 n=1 Tax=Silene latifolia TaxID=37657 RepID=UPI003D785CE9